MMRRMGVGGGIGCLGALNEKTNLLFTKTRARRKTLGCRERPGLQGRCRIELSLGWGPASIVLN